MTATSAGIRAVIGHPIQHDAAAVIERLGGDASDFAARQLTAKIANDADLVITMTKAHRDAVLELAPRRLRKTFILSEASLLASHAETIEQLADLRPQLTGSSAPDVPDPIGQSPAVFAAIGSQIADLLTPLLDLCRRTAEDNSS